MGKAKKIKVSHCGRNNPLDQQILESRLPKQSTRVKRRNRRDADEEFVDNRLSKKILEQAREQQEELEEEYEYSTAYKLSSKLEGMLIHGKDEFSETDETDDEDSPATRPSYVSDINVSEDDKKALELFMGKDSSEAASLVEMLKEKLTEKRTELESHFSDTGSMKVQNSEYLVSVYQRVGTVLAHYRSGKIPKFFKCLPSRQDWEQLLHLTEPDKWTSAAVFQATRIFASNLKENMAQRFYNIVLLPRLRDEIAQCKTLNFHLYQAVVKSLFKPGAFFKGIVLPLCESGTCTLREATIIGSVIAKFSLPVLHASAALMMIAGMDYTGANSIFMRVLLEKKYSLPFRTIDTVVTHFLRFAQDKKVLPVLWHQCLLTFAQYYKNDISTDQQEHLLKLLEVHSHHHITPEIRRELESGKCRYNGK